MGSIRRFLEVKLKLTVNEQKSSVAATDRITFLGFSFNLKTAVEKDAFSCNLPQ